MSPVLRTIVKWHIFILKHILILKINNYNILINFGFIS